MNFGWDFSGQRMYAAMYGERAVPRSFVRLGHWLEAEHICQQHTGNLGSMSTTESFMSLKTNHGKSITALRKQGETPMRGQRIPISQSGLQVGHNCVHDEVHHRSRF